MVDGNKADECGRTLVMFLARFEVAKTLKYLLQTQPEPGITLNDTNEFGTTVVVLLATSVW